MSDPDQEYDYRYHDDLQEVYEYENKNYRPHNRIIIITAIVCIGIVIKWFLVP